MPASLNRVFLIGNLTRDPELRYVPSGTAVASFTIAVNRFYNTPTGERKEETSFIRVVVWGRRAELCGEYLSKGSSVFVEGRLRSRSWEAPDGQKRSTIEVTATSVQFLRTGKMQVSSEKMPSDETPVNQEIPDDMVIEQDKGNTKGKKSSDEEDKVPF
jgi:single-strand DNA-binding protein